jgi:hypothetical protein
MQITAGMPPVGWPRLECLAQLLDKRKKNQQGTAGSGTLQTLLALIKIARSYQHAD